MIINIKYLILAVVFLIITTALKPLEAEEKKVLDSSETKYSSPFFINPGIDGTIILLAGTISLVPVLVEDEIPYKKEADLDRNNINSFDRSAADYDNEHLSLVSDACSAIVPLGVYGLTFLYDKENRRDEFIEDLVIMTESFAVSGALYQVVAHSIQRPRPYMYREESSQRRGSSWDYSSFYSGHTANATALSISAAYIHSVRYPQSPYSGLIWGTAICGNLGVGVLRVMSGNHFWTDILMGFSTGAGIGLLVPMLHRSETTYGTVNYFITPQSISATFYY